MNAQEFLIDYGKRLSQDKYKIPVLRELHQGIIEKLPGVEDSRDFSFLFMYKGLIEDVLRNTTENISLDVDFTEKALEHLAESLLNLDNPEEWQTNMNKFSSFYRALSFATFQPEQIVHDGFRALHSPEHIPILSKDGLGNEVMPNLDINLCDPKYVKKVTDLFLEKIKNVRERFLEKEGRDLSLLAFIRKAYGAVGAHTLSSALVTATDLYAFFYHESQWPAGTKIRGQKPTCLDSICLVHDALVDGISVINLNRFLPVIEEYHPPKVDCAVFYTNFADKETLNKLEKEEGVIIDYILDFSDKPF